MSTTKKSDTRWWLSRPLFKIVEARSGCVDIGFGRTEKQTVREGRFVVTGPLDYHADAEKRWEMNRIVAIIVIAGWCR
jgi:hypothetical protein